MQFNRYDIPGFREAVKAENDARDAAFLNIPADICGIKIRQMTPRDYLVLNGIDNPIVCGGLPNPNHIAHFLYLMAVKPGWRWWHARRSRKLDYREVISALNKYLEATWQDLPGGSTSGSIPIASWLAHHVEFIATQYGWSLDDILNIPMRILFQLINVSRSRMDSNYKVHARHGKVLGDRLKRINEELKLRLARESFLNCLRTRATEK